MPQSLNAMFVALQVLTAINEGRRPDPIDVAKLHGFAGPQPAGVDLDDFACEVIQNAIKAALRGGVDPFQNVKVLECGSSQF